MTRALGFLVAAMALVAGFVDVAWAQSPGPGQDPVAGARVFDAKGCVKCHALNGSGGKVGPDLARIARPRSFYDLGAAMWNHLPRMTVRMKQLGIARPELTADEAKNLVGFLYTVGYFDAPGNTETGKRLFTTKHCAECHGPAGPGPSVDRLKAFGSPLYAAAAMWNHGPQMADVMKAKGIERPTFTAPELRDLIAYLSPGTGAAAGSVFVLPGDAERGRVLFADKQCVQCHRVGGAGGSVGPSLTDKGVRRSPLEFAAAIWNKAPAMTAAMATRNITTPELQPEEMADLVGRRTVATLVLRQASNVASGCLDGLYQGGDACPVLIRGQVSATWDRGEDAPHAIANLEFESVFSRQRCMPQPQRVKRVR